MLAKKTENAAGYQVPRVIVDELREQARSYNKALRAVTIRPLFQFSVLSPIRDLP